MNIKEEAENSVQNEIRGHLIEVPHVDEDEGNSKGHHDNTIVYYSTFVAVCGSFAFGNCMSYSSPTETGIRKDLNLTIAEYSWFVSIMNLGAMIGSITSGRLADFFGRKGAMRVGSFFCAVGWVAIFSAQGPVALDIGRLASGYGIGLFSYAVPVFIAEIAPTNLRGALTTTHELMNCIGVSAVATLGTVLTWRALALLGLIPCSIMFFGLFLIPESPRWLAKTGNKKGFEAALRKLRGEDADISEEAVEIQDYIETLEKLPKASILDLFQQRYLGSLIVGVGLMIAQMFSGVNAVVFYASSIFESAGFPPKIGIIILSLLPMVVVSMAGSLFIEKAGRKPLLLEITAQSSTKVIFKKWNHLYGTEVSTSGLVLGCLLTALSFYFTTYQIALKTAPAFAMIGLLVYVGFYEIGMGPVSWVIMSEIFPIHIKGIAGSLATLANWAAAWVVSYSFNFLMAWSSYGTFLLYAGVNMLVILFVVKVVPETKGRTLEQIQTAINKQ